MAHASSHTDHHGRDRLIRWARVYDLGIGLLGRRGSASAPCWLMIFSSSQATASSMWAVALAALRFFFAERVAPTGSVDGIDAAAEMINRARSQTRRRGVPATFQVAFAQDLPFADETSTRSRAPSLCTTWLRMTNRLPSERCTGC